MDPSKILFSTPTLNDALPAASDVPVDDECVRIHEDDWRQFEFVAETHRDQVQRELNAIDGVWKNSAVPVGEYHAFRKVHVRSLLPLPLAVSWSAQEFALMFDADLKPLSFWDWGSVVRNVFAATVANLTAYAEFKDHRVITLGLEPLGRLILPLDIANRLAQFVTSHQLMLVHWRSRTLFDGPAVMRYLRGEPQV